MPTPVPTIVLVHGALTDAAIWHDVIADLQQRGHRVLAPAITMRSLTADAANLRSVLASLQGPVVVAGHSYGGSVISHPDALTPSVRGLVYVAAFQQDHHESAGELNYRFPGSLLTPDTTRVREHPDGGDLTLRPEHFAQVYAADLDPRTSAVLAAAQHPIDPKAFGETFTEPASWTRLPSWTLIATADRSVPTQVQRFMAERAGSTITEVASSHAVPLAQPKATADLIATAAGAVAAAASPE